MPDFLNREDALLLVVDVQERLVPAIHQELYPRSLKNMKIMIESAGTLGVPILLTEQYPKGLGTTLASIEDGVRDAANLHRFDKLVFSTAGCAEFAAIAPALGRDQWIVTGMETHVCVYQTARGLADRGYQAHVVSDAVASRTKANWQIGLQLAERSGAVLTSTEVCVFDLLGGAGSEDFKALSKLIK